MPTITLKTYLLVCPFVFLGGFVDSIAGGGGLITLPAYMLAGLPGHFAIGTNKISSMMGTSVSMVRVLRSGLVRWKLALPCILCALTGSFLGAGLALRLSDALFKKMLLVLLPVCAFAVLSKKVLRENDAEPPLTPKLYALVCSISFLCGVYDGFYGPGTGTFLLLGYLAIARLPVNTAYSTMKAVNLSSNIAAFAVFISNGRIIVPLGLAAGLSNMLGNYLGSGLALKNGSRIVRPVIIFVVVLLMIKLLTEL